MVAAFYLALSLYFFVKTVTLQLGKVAPADYPWPIKIDRSGLINRTLVSLVKELA